MMVQPAVFISVIASTDYLWHALYSNNDSARRGSNISVSSVSHWHLVRKYVPQ